jgi:hypothetical protein
MFPGSLLSRLRRRDRIPPATVAQMHGNSFWQIHVVESLNVAGTLNLVYHPVLRANGAVHSATISAAQCARHRQVSRTV